MNFFFIDEMDISFILKFAILLYRLEFFHSPHKYCQCEKVHEPSTIISLRDSCAYKNETKKISYFPSIAKASNKQFIENFTLFADVGRLIFV